MAVENLNVHGIIIPHRVIEIVGDGSCLFRSLSYIIYHTEDKSSDIREIIVKHVSEHWEQFSILTYFKNGDNHANATEYITDMRRDHVFGGLCELVAAGQIFQFLFEVYFQGRLYEKFGNEMNPVGRLRFNGDLSNGHFDVYIPVEIADGIEGTSQTSSTEKNKRKRRARYTDKTRKKQLRESSKKYQETHPEDIKKNKSQHQKDHPKAHQTAVSKYQKSHPQVHQKAVSKYQQNHPEKHQSASTKYQQNHPEVHQSAATKYQQNHPEVHQSATTKYQENHPETHQAASSKYQQNHPDVHRAAVLKYQQNYPEVHNATQARHENNNPGLRTEQRLRPWKNKVLMGFAYEPDIAYGNDIGRMENVCSICSAKKFKRESPGMCCSSGKVWLPPLQPPPEPLNSLLIGLHPDHRHFIERIRQYNGCFQMTSFGAKQIFENGFMPTFKVQGQVYHLCGSLRPKLEDDNKFLQIYFVGNDEKEARIRCSNYPDLKPGLVKQLQRMLHDVNIYVKNLKSTLEKVPSECENFQVVIRADRKPENAHRGCFNAPAASEVALVIVGQQFDKRDIVLESRDNKLKRISELHRSYDTLQYPLMFCYGEDGYSIDVQQQDPRTKLSTQKTVSASQFYSWRIMLRMGEENYLLRYGALLSQFLVDEYGKIETEKLNYLRHNQRKLRAEEYIHLRDEVGRHDADELGQRVVLPSSFTGGPRYMHERAQDALTYVRHYGSSDLFITFTCNPKWIEIQRELYPGQKHYQRHDIIARVFHLKVKEFMDLLTKGKLFGQVRCHMFSVEWQKRGLPHIHILLWLEERITNDKIDKIVCAEIPCANQDPALYNIVKSNMIHGPCGSLNKDSPCLKNGYCTKRYPRPFVQQTQKGEDGYPLYRRRTPDEGGCTVNINGIDLDNRWVVPYNPVLLRTFEAHINVEITNSVKSIKYICKYITKGSDQAAFTLENNNIVNEIEIYESGRYISSSEAVWRILGFPIHERYPTVTNLAVHLENGQRVYFTADNLAEKLANPPMTTLLAFFYLCQNDDFARTLLYCEVPAYYVWQQNKTFTRRKRGESVEGWPGIMKDSALGRVYTIHPKNSECYHLRLLLHHVRGPTSFSHLKTVNGIIHPTFQSACVALGLLEDDKQWQDCLEEAVLTSSSFKLRELFTVILWFCNPSDPKSLWDKYKDNLAEDIIMQFKRELEDSTVLDLNEIYNRCLILIEDNLQALGGECLTNYGLPKPERTGVQLKNGYFQENGFAVEEVARAVSSGEQSLTYEQFTVYREILDNIDSGNGRIFFLDAPGGTGKTFLINLLLLKVRGNNGIALAVASSGIAATLLKGGRTAHSTFKLPLNLYYTQNPICNIKKQSDLAKVLRECKLIIWDESTMAHKGAFEALNITLQDIRNCSQPMGGITLLLAGDFRQTLPVIPRGTRANEVKACIKSSYLWPHVRKLSLSKNMRVYLGGDKCGDQFSELLLQIGDGRYPESLGKVKIPSELATVVNNKSELIEKIYPDILNIKLKSNEWFCERAILSPKNDKAAEINDILLESFEGEDVYYKSFDVTTNMDDAVQYPAEFLNTLNPPGFPPHRLKLKVGTPVMLLRNLNPPKLCNGTRLRVTALRKNIIEATIITGCARGESVLIPRIPLIPSDYPFEFKRVQFPVKVCFAMTINKSQGQSLKVAGIDLREDCFSHGQYYVACSRVSSANCLVILAPEGKTANVVYKEVLT